jgi:hypothetical protein
MKFTSAERLAILITVGIVFIVLTVVPVIRGQEVNAGLIAIIGAMGGAVVKGFGGSDRGGPPTDGKDGGDGN